MKVDWKKLSKSAGYKSLKAAYVHDVQEAARSAARGHRPMRDKQEFLKKLRWVIARAKHYAYHQNKSLEYILNKWEKDRTFWWLNYYQDSAQPEFKGSRYPQEMGIRGWKKYWLNSRLSKSEKSKRTCREIMRCHKLASTKSPKRWVMDLKKRKAYIRKSS